MTMHEQRADSRQQAAVRAQLHAAVDEICNLWPHLDTIAHQTATVLPSTSVTTPHGQHTPADRTAQNACHLGDYHDWNAHLTETRAHLVTLAAQARVLLVSDGPTNRPTVFCAACGQPGWPRLVRTLDGQPYHAEPGPDGRHCFWQTAARMTNRPNGT